MKIAVVTLGSIGDLLPFLVVGTALRDRGHELIFASHAGYESLVKMAGFPFRAIWDGGGRQQTLDDVLDSNPDEAWSRVHHELFEAATAPALHFIESVAEKDKSIVLASWSAFGARLAHEKLNLSLCSVYLSPHALQEKFANPGAGGGSGGAKQLHLGFFPAWFASHPSGGPQVRMTGFPMFDEKLVPALPPELECFLEDGEPPIVFTPGSFVKQSASFFRESLAACEMMKWRAVFLTPQRAQVPATLPSSVIHFKYVSLQRLLRRSAALVYHGGIGTCAQAMKAGIPHLVTPLFFDQFDNAARVTAMGIGESMAPREYDRHSAAQTMDRMLRSEPLKQNCLHAAGLFRDTNPVAEICAIIESLA